ncbi:MAG: FecR family protein [Spirochaetes bacterium]|nr:FecR family protein [Spirochaetota bacterium]
MRKIILMILLIFLFVTTINITIYSQEKQSTSSQGQTKKVAVKIVYPVGEVLIYDMSNPLAQPITAKVDMLLYANYKVETKAQSSVELVFDDGTVIKIAEKSIFEIKELQEIIDQNKKTKKSVFNIVAGTVRAIVAKVKGQDSTFQINTPNGVASVRGTDLGISVDPQNGKTDLYVFKGLVAFGPSLTNQIMVEAGKMASIIGQTMSQVVNIPEDVKNNFLQNMKTDSPEPVESIDTTTGQTQTVQIPEQKKEQVKKETEKKVKSAFEEWLEKNLNMIGDFGTIVIDGKIWSLFTINTEFALGNVGIGIYAPIIFDPAKGGLFEPKNWYNYNEYIFSFASYQDTFKTLYSIVTKIKYLRINEHDDPFYFKIGSIDDFIIGNGLNMYYYSNMINFPAIRYLGVQLKFESEVFAMDIMTNNILKPSVVGLRPALKPFKKQFPLQVGIEVIGDLEPLYDSTNNNPVIGGVAAGLILPVIPNNNFFSLFLFGDIGTNYYIRKNGEIGILKGFGVFAGVRGSYFFGTYRAEYRMIYNDFLPQMFNNLYDINKENIYLYYKNKIINPTNIETIISGFYFNLTINVLKKIHGDVSYVHYFTLPSSFIGVLGDTMILGLILEKDLIPKVFGELSVKKVNWNVFVPKPFENFTDNLFVYLKIGYEVDKGIAIIIGYNVFFVPDGQGGYKPSISYTVNAQLSF